MLPARSRMRRRKDFETALRGDRRAGRRLLVVHLGKAVDTVQTPRIGFAVSRAVGNAPTRNRVRRRLRHLAADRLGRLPDDARLVIRAKPAAAQASFAGLGRELDMTLDRLVRRSRDDTGAI